MKEDRVAIFGSTGLLGRKTVEVFRENYPEIRVISRNRDKLQKLFGDDFEQVVADGTDENSLNEALQGVTRIHISIASGDESLIVKNIVKAAATAGIKYITYISRATVSKENTWFPMIKQKYLAEEIIRKSGIDHSIFCPSWTFDSLGNFVKGNRALIIGKQTNPFHLLSANDLGSIVLSVVKGEFAGKKRFVVLGPEEWMIKDALRDYCKILHPEIRQIEEIPLGTAKLLSLVLGKRDFRRALKLFGYFEKAGERDALSKIDPGTGVLTTATSLAQWLGMQITRTMNREEH